MERGGAPLQYRPPEGLSSVGQAAYLAALAIYPDRSVKLHNKIILALFLGAASGITAIARSVGASLSPVLTGIFLANAALFNLPFFLSGGLKIIYDLALYRSFITIRPPEE